MSKHRLPSYRLHKPSGQAVVTLNGKEKYLGQWKSKASRIEYDRLIGEWLANGRQFPVSNDPSKDLSIIELIAAYWDYAKGYYVKNGEPTSELDCFRSALRPLKRLYSHTRVIDFSPLSLVALRNEYIKANHSRGFINASTRRLKRMFKWGVSRELVPVHIYQALATVDGLKVGRSEARETLPVKPVSKEDIEATLPHLNMVVRAMVEFQLLTACRPGEVRLLRPCDIDSSNDVWIYKPQTHKMEHQNRERLIFIGPKAQAILKPWLNQQHTSFCFKPEEVKRLSSSNKRNRRVKNGRPPKSSTKRAPGDHYERQSYNRAITRACDRAGIERWKPNQLRHTRATEIRQKYGLEASQTVLGHSRADVTQIYAERNDDAARRIILKEG